MSLSSLLHSLIQALHARQADLQGACSLFFLVSAAELDNSIDGELRSSKAFKSAIELTADVASCSLLSRAIAGNGCCGRCC